MNLSGDDIWKVTAEPKLYERAPFLQPMRASALKVHAQFGNKSNCPACQRNAMIRAINSIGSAFGRLVIDESKKPSNQLASLHKVLEEILGSTIQEAIISYKLGGKEHEVRF